MGLEATCTAMLGGQRSKGTARLEEDTLRFDGDFQVRWAFRDMGAIRVTGSTVVVEHPQGALRLELGDKAQKWYERLRTSRSRLDRLGISRNERVLLAGFDDPSFRAELAEREVDLARSPLRSDNDTIVGAVRRPEELARLTTWKSRMQPNGKMWVLWPRGGADLKEEDVRARGKQLGMVDVLVARFSDDWSALKLVVRKENRPGGEKTASTKKAMTLKAVAPEAPKAAASKSASKAVTKKAAAKPAATKKAVTTKKTVTKKTVTKKTAAVPKATTKKATKGAR